MLGQSLLWSGLGAVALGVGVGVQLGDSAVRQIDPLYFQGPAIHPRDRGAALDPNALPGPITSPYLQAYGWAQSERPLYADSGGADYPYAPEPAVTVHRLAEPEWEAVPAPAMEPWPPGQVAEHPEVERYARFPIEEKPAAQAETRPPAQMEPRPAAQPLSTAPVLVYDR